MHRKSLKWFGVTLLAGMASAGVASAAQGYLYISGIIQNYSCGTPGANNYYYAEGIGYDSGGNIVCEVSGQISGPLGAVGIGLCTGLAGVLVEATTHAARIVVRSNTDGSWVNTLATANKSTGAWLNSSTVITYTVPAHDSCASDLITARSRGYAVNL